MKIPFSVYDFFGYLAAGACLLVGLDYAFGWGKIIGHEFKAVDTIIFVVIAYIIGHIIAHLSSVLLEQWFVRKVLVPPETSLFMEQQTSWKKVFPFFFKPLPTATTNRVIEKAEQRGFGEKSGSALFFHCFALVKPNETALQRMNTFLALYGFCRSISLTSLILVPVLIATAYRDEKWQAEHFWFAGAASVIGVGMLYRYLKFFKHYSLEVFQTYAELPDE